MNQTEPTTTLPSVAPEIGNEQLLSVSSVVRPEKSGFEATLDKMGAVVKWQMAVRYALVAGALAVVFVAGYLLGHRQSSYSVALNGPMDWGKPTWSDDFDGQSGQLPDPSRWVQENNSQDGSKGSPCSARLNCLATQRSAFLNGAGQLVLRASRNSDDSWTAARLSTRGIKDFQYGRIEARMKLPVGAGLWPAFWLMGSTFSKVGWPAAGSIDIMENVGTQNGRSGLGPSVIRSTLHGPGALRMNTLADQTMSRISVVCTDHRAVEFLLIVSWPRRSTFSILLGLSRSCLLTGAEQVRGSPIIGTASA